MLGVFGILTPSLRSSIIVNLLRGRCSDSKCLHEVLQRIRSKNLAQRTNAIDVVSDLIHLSSGSVETIPEAGWCVTKFLVLTFMVSQFFLIDFGCFFQVLIYSDYPRQDVANHLLECLGGDDHIIQNRAANLIPKIGKSASLIDQ